MKLRIVEVSLDVSDNTESEGRLWFHGRVKVRPFSMPSPGCKQTIALPLIETFPCPATRSSRKFITALASFGVFRLSVAKHALAGYPSTEL